MITIINTSSIIAAPQFFTRVDTSISLPPPGREVAKHLLSCDDFASRRVHVKVAMLGPAFLAIVKIAAGPPRANHGRAGLGFAAVTTTEISPSIHLIFLRG
jgi:hypothetical protein